MKKQARVVCFTGPSGVGKTSYANRLMRKYGFAQPIIATTRKKREDDNQYYHYVTESVFSKMVRSNSFLEWDNYMGRFYGTLLQGVEKSLHAKDSFGIVLDLTPNGCRQVIKIIPTATLIALLPDDPAWLFKRLQSRNSQTQEEILERTKQLDSYLKKIHSLPSCKKVYAGFSPESWDKTFEIIERIILE